MQCPAPPSIPLPSVPHRQLYSLAKEPHCLENARLAHAQRKIRVMEEGENRGLTSSMAVPCHEGVTVNRCTHNQVLAAVSLQVYLHDRVIAMQQG